MIRVRFNDAEEFAAELSREKPNDNILRLTKQYQQSKDSPHIHYVSVLGSFVRDGQIIKMTTYCGDYWGKGTDRSAVDRADKVMMELEQVARELGVEVRAGVYEEAKE